MPRRLPPGAAPIRPSNLLHALRGLWHSIDYVARFERELLSYFGVRHCFLLSSGRAALSILLDVLRDIYPDRDEVIIPAYTCYSVPAAVVRSGCRPSLCDISPTTLDFDYGLLKSRISDRVLAVIPCNLFGIPSDITRLKKTIDNTPPFIIDDAAQAMGISSQGRFLGTRGDAGIFSLDRGKNFTTVQGGIILTDNDIIADKIESRIAALPSYSLIQQLVLWLKACVISFFLKPARYWMLANIPFLGLGKTIYSTKFARRRLSGVQAGLAFGWQKDMERYNKIRKDNALYYHKKIRNSNTKTQAVTLGLNEDCTPHRFPYLLPDSAPPKNQVVKECAALGIGPAYPGTIADIKDLKLSKADSEIHKAVSIAGRLITLPTHPYVNHKDMDDIIKRLQGLNAL